MESLFFHTDFNLAKFYSNLNQMSVDFQKMIEKSKKNYFPDFLDAIKNFLSKKLQLKISKYLLILLIGILVTNKKETTHD